MQKGKGKNLCALGCTVHPTQLGFVNSQLGFINAQLGFHLGGCTGLCLKGKATNHVIYNKKRMKIEKLNEKEPIDADYSMNRTSTRTQNVCIT